MTFCEKGEVRKRADNFFKIKKVEAKRTLLRLFCITKTDSLKTIGFYVHDIVMVDEDGIICIYVFPGFNLSSVPSIYL